MQSGHLPLSPAVTHPARPGGGPERNERTALMSDSTHLAGRFAETAGPRQDGAEHDHWGGEAGRRTPHQEGRVIPWH